MRVCYFGTYRANYSRNRIMMEGLRRNGVEVIECHETLWRGTEDRVAAASGAWRRPAFIWRLLRAYARLIWRYLRTPPHDVVMVGYPGQFDVYLARLLTWLRGVPLVWDIFMSIYLIALERGLDAQSGFTARLLRRVERFACRLPDRLIMDTEDYVQWFARVHDVPVERFRLVPTGADDTAHPPCSPVTDSTGPRIALYYGTFIRNHGVEWIVEAARLLRDEGDIHFEFIGDGPEREAALALAESYRLPNVTFIPWLDKERLQERIERATICLGAFGTTPQSLMTAQNKLYECMAVGRPIVSGDSPAVRRVFTHGQHLWLVPRADPQGLADAIRLLSCDAELRAKLAQGGHAEFMAHYTVARIGERFAGWLKELVSS